MPDWKEEVREQLAGLNLAAAREAEIVEELAQHLEDRYEHLLVGDVTPEAASNAVLAELRESDLLVQELRRVEQRVSPEPIVLGANTAGNMIAGLWRDIRGGARSLRKNPGLTFIALITLILG